MRLIFSFTRVLRRWPRLRRRVIISRRCYHKVYWYLYEFKEEFIDEYYRAPQELNRRARELEEPREETPFYYEIYRFITFIPAGFRAYLHTFKEDWDTWVKFRDEYFSGYNKVSSEIKETYKEDKPKFKRFILTTLRMYRNAFQGFHKGYQESMSDKPFPSEELIHNEQSESDQSSKSGNEEGDEVQK